MDLEIIDIIARLTSRTLGSLDLCFEESMDAESCYYFLDEFFERCHGIRNLQIRYFDFGDVPFIFPSIEDGFSRLSQLKLEDCRGDTRVFMEFIPIPNLLSFSTEAFGSTVEDSDSMNDHFKSFSTLLEFVECCRDIEVLYIYIFIFKFELI